MKKANSKKESKIVPMGDRVLIRPFKEMEALRQAQGKKSFNIILPESVTNEKSDKGKVIAVGAGKWEDGKLRPVGVKVGQTVIFSKYGYDEVKMNDEELYLVKEENILAVIN